MSNNIPQQILAKCLTELAYIRKDNGYQSDFNQKPIKGMLPYSDSNNNNQSFFYFGDANVISYNENYSLGRIQLPLIILVHYSANQLQGTLTDTGEIIIQDLIDWFIGTFTMQSTIRNLDGVNSAYVKQHYRVFETNTRTGGTCGIQIFVDYEGAI